MRPLLLSRYFLTWICVVGVGLSSLVSRSGKENDFFRAGPHENLDILGIQINTYPRYMVLVIYTFVNSLFRTLSSNVISPWIINHIQDTERDKTTINHRHAYEIATTNVIYHWMDWLLYMNILLAQIDLVAIEVCADLTMTWCTTYLYLRHK